MATLKVIRKRIASVKNTQKITKAMKMVSAAKLRRAQEAAEAARSYADKLAALLQNVAARIEDRSHPLLQQRDQVSSMHVLLVTGDRGLCGGYNTNLIRRMEALLKEHGRERVRLTIVGRRGFDYFKRRGVNIADKHINLFGGPGVSLAQSLAEQLAREFAEGTTDGVYVLYSHFKSAITQVPTVQQLLPIRQQEEAAENSQVDYIYEPDAATLLDRLLRQYVSVVVHRAFLEAAASEHGARMAAMDSATNNASDMIGRLTLDMNRARQAAITKELMEIVSGAEALKG